jgi:hypothetical protein
MIEASTRSEQFFCNPCVPSANRSIYGRVAVSSVFVCSASGIYIRASGY